MSDQAVRQRYRLATGGGQNSPPPKTSNPGYRSGGTVKKQAGGACYSKGGKPSRGR